MSLTLITYLLLFLSFFSLHACNARRLIISSLDHKKLENKTHFSLNKINVDFSPKKLGSTNGGEYKRKNIGFVAKANDEKPKIIMDTTRTRRSKQRKRLNNVKAKGKKPTTSSSSSSSVSWHVPHKKNGDKNPGFNVDYSPPKTHPPSHN